MDSHTDVIAAFGGQASLARALGEEPARACHWNERGIPAKHWHEVEDLAREAGLPVTARVLKTLPRSRKAGLVRHDRAA